MNKLTTLRFVSNLRALAFGVATALLAASTAHAVTTNSVLYSVPRQIVQGNMPLTTSYTLQITSPVYFPVGVISQVALNTTVLTAPANVSNATALSFVTYTPLQTGLVGGLVASIPLLNQITSAVPVLTFTGPNQTISVTVNVNIPDGAWAGSFGYEISTFGWPSMLSPKGFVVPVDDQGAFINVTAARVASANGPVITINQPMDQTVYTWYAGDPSLNIPYEIDGATLDGSALTAMNATVTYVDANGATVTQNMTLSPVGLGVPNTTTVATGTFNAPVPGVYTINANDANAVGTASATTQITVQVMAGPPTVSIKSPAPNSTYTMTAGTELDIPYSFTGISQYSGITLLTATLDGVPVAFTPNGYGNLTATGTGILPITTGGEHVLDVTATDANGFAETSESIFVTVVAPQSPPAVVINTPAPNATFTLYSGGNLTVPFTFTGSSTITPITALSATVNGVPVTFSTSGLNTISATGSTNLTITAAGTYNLKVTATNAVGTALATQSFTVVVQNAPGTPFKTGDFTTYTIGGWGIRLAGTNSNFASFVQWFNRQYPQGLEVGIADCNGYSIRFVNQTQYITTTTGSGKNKTTTTTTVQVYGSSVCSSFMQANKGSGAALTVDLVDPASSSTGTFGTQVIGCRLAIDYNGSKYANLKIKGTGTCFDGRTLLQAQATFESILGGAGNRTGLAFGDLTSLATYICSSFDAAVPSTWAQAHLTY